jgi:vancomycin resistance protein VanJ
MPSATADSESPAQLPPDTRRLLWRWLFRWCGRLALAAFILWLVGFAILLALFRWVGEGNPATVFALYLPPNLWLLPGLCLWPLVLIFRFRSALWLGGLAALLTTWGLGYRFAADPDPLPREARPTHTMVVLTNNRGQHGGHSLRPFKNGIQPDLMLFQESSAPAASYLRDPGYAEFSHGQTLGEFTLLSRFPILKAEAITRSSAGQNYRYAARFEIDWNGTRIAIFNVHFPSPRGTLLAMRGGSFLYGLPVPSSSWASRRQKLTAFWDEHLGHATDLIARLQSEPLPFLLAGDFNAPHLGAIHRLLTQKLTDAQAEAGHGFGFTFPGETRNPLALGSPWLRIDYVFAGPGWQVDACWTEPERPSQHRAVAALLSLPPDTKGAEGRLENEQRGL